MEKPRDYLAEARSIVEGGTMRLTEKGHLVALDRQLAAMNRNIITLGEILVAILHDNGVPAMAVPKAALEAVRAARVIPIIQSQPDGSVVVRLTDPAAGPAPGRTATGSTLVQ